MSAGLTGRRVGPFEVQGLLGKGGMGDVYRVRDTRLGRHVAMKVLPAEVSASPERLARFEREARLVAALSHPNILTLFETGTDAGVAYAIFELLEGETLRGRLASGALPPRQAVEIATAVARGLAAAHARGIVHRDLKPENVFLTHEGGAKVLDFGLARQGASDSAPLSHAPTEELLTGAGTLLGTVGYMSPEQVRGEKLDHRSDLFALGCVLYEMLGGRRPFDGASAPETLAAVLRQEPAPLANDQPPGAARIVERCLQKDPARRFQSADDLAFALDGLLDRPSAPQQASGPAASSASLAGRRPRASVVMGALALLALGALAGGLAVRGARAPEAPSFERVSFRRGSIFQARFAPDGRTVLYSAAFDGGPPEVYETRLGNPDARPLGLAPANLLAVSAGEVAITRRPTFPLTYYQPGQLARLSLAGGAARDLVDGVNAADWTADGGELVVARSVDGVTRIEWPLGTRFYETPRQIGSLRVSPHGDRVAFFEYEPGTTAEAVVMDRAGGRRVLMAGIALPSGGLAWLPDGREVWATVVEASGDTGRLYAFGLDGARRLVLAAPGGVRLHDIAADGRVLLSQVNMRVSLHVGTERAPDRDLSWFGYSVVNDLSADGARLLLSDLPAVGLDGRSLLLRGADGSPAVRLGAGLYAFQSRLSPDGRWAAARGPKPSEPLRVEPTGAGEGRTLPMGALARIEAWAWLADSTGLVLTGARADGSAVLAEQSLAGGDPHALAGGCEPRDLLLSTDGRFVACHAGDRLLVLARDGSSRRELAPSEPVGTLVRWSGDGRSLYSYRQGEMPAAILRTDLVSGRVEVGRTLDPPDPTGVWRVHPIAVTPDGRAWAYSTARWLGDLYVYSGLR
jgi:hypothetical protein